MAHARTHHLSWTDVGRAFGGALIFALPILMTMEMWQLGLYVDRWRLLLLLLANLPLLVVVARLAGFERTTLWSDAVRDGLIGYTIGIVTSALILALLGVVPAGHTLGGIAGVVALQAVPASIGAVLGRSQLGGGHSRPAGRSESAGYISQMFLMAIGALFLGLNIAPTEEVLRISFQMTAWHELGLIVLSLVLMHAFVYALEFRGGTPLTPETPWWSAFLRFSLPGYVVAVFVSLFVLWVFHRLDGLPADETLSLIIVLAFPAALGAAAARLIL